MNTGREFTFNEWQVWLHAVQKHPMNKLIEHCEINNIDFMEVANVISQDEQKSINLKTKQSEVI
jgi:hypothetical protein